MCKVNIYMKAVNTNQWTREAIVDSVGMSRSQVRRAADLLYRLYLTLTVSMSARSACLRDMFNRSHSFGFADSAMVDQQEFTLLLS